METTRKFGNIFATLLLVGSILVSGLFGLVAKADTPRVLPKSDYTVTTKITNNGLTVVDKGRYGESKFIITPTFRIDDQVTLVQGDEIHFVLPDELQFDTAVTRSPFRSSKPKNRSRNVLRLPKARYTGKRH